MLTYLWNAVVAVGPILGPLLIIAVVLGYGLRKIPPMYYGRVSAFGKRGRVVKEGLRFLIPFVEEVEFYSKEMQRIPLEVTATSKDKLEIILQVTVTFVPDWNLITAYEESTKERNGELIDGIRAVVGEIAGVKKAEDFIQRREAIGHLINCLLRLKDLPHEGVSINQRLQFYEILASEISQLLKKETSVPDERSEIEDKLGIDILDAHLKQIDFSPATKAALEKDRQTQAAMKATERMLGTAERIQKTLNLEGSEAANFVLVTAGHAKKQVVAMEGRGMSPIPFLNLGGEGGGGGHEGGNRGREGNWKRGGK
ncbi:MAG: SPFH domain-containing protein [bacterium]|nr:SPFH domain-containing protein [bacterium]